MAKNRWQVACINWGHPTAPKAVAYRISAAGWAECVKYCSAWREAYNHADRMARTRKSSDS